MNANTATADVLNGADQLAIIIPRLRALRADITPEQETKPTPCASFDVAGVIHHMTTLGSAFAPMFRGEDPPADAPTPEFDGAMADLLDAVSSPGALKRTITTPNGPMPGADFARFVAFDGLVHGWDLATASGQPWEFDDALVLTVDAFARQAIGPDMRDGDAFGPAVDAPPGATPLERLAAFSGRDVTTRREPVD